jgi:hypothetical protein
LKKAHTWWAFSLLRFASLRWVKARIMSV